MNFNYPNQPNFAQPVPQPQNNGFMIVPNEDIARNYPVAPGNCVTFKIEGQPIVIEKSMGFSQLDSPKLERYRLIKEEPVETNIPVNKDEIQELWDAVNEIKAKLETPTTRRKKDVDAGHDE